MWVGLNMWVEFIMNEILFLSISSVSSVSTVSPCPSFKVIVVAELDQLSDEPIVTVAIADKETLNTLEDQ